MRITRQAITDDFVHLQGEMVAHHAADVRAQAVADAVDAVRRRAAAGQVRVELRRALRDQTTVADGGEVAGERRQDLPVHCEHVVVAATQVC